MQELLKKTTFHLGQINLTYVYNTSEKADSVEVILRAICMTNHDFPNITLSWQC